MKKMNFYLLPVKSFRALDENAVLDIFSVISAIKENDDIFSILLDFYTVKDSDGVTFFDLYLPQNSNSTTKLLISEMSKSYDSSKSLHEIDADDFGNGFIGFKDQILPDLPEELIACDIDMLVEAYQKSALHILNSYTELYEWRKKCYPDLLFTDDAFEITNSHFNDSNKEKLWKQTHECLAALNYLSKARDDVKDNNERIKWLGSKLSGITVSGKGTNEKNEDFEKDVCFNENKYIISCAPHFKLIARHLDYRIYFSWGIKEIEQFEFIVAHVGEHWNKRFKSESKICT